MSKDQETQTKNRLSKAIAQPGTVCWGAGMALHGPCGCNPLRVMGKLLLSRAVTDRSFRDLWEPWGARREGEPSAVTDTHFLNAFKKPS